MSNYGETVKKTAKKLLENNVYQFMGSDAHSYDRYKVFDDAKEPCGEASVEYKIGAF